MAVAFALTAAVTACGDDDDPTGDNGGDSGGGGGGATEVLKLGLITSETGPVAASAGIPYFRGMTMAADEINEAGGIEIGDSSYEIELLQCDDQSTAEGASACGQQIVQNDQPSTIVTPTSYAALALLGFNVEQDFFLYATAQALQVTDQGNPLVVRGMVNSAKTMAGFIEQTVALLDKAGIEDRKVYSMQVNTDLGEAWNGAFEDAWEDEGGEIIGNGTVDNAATDFSAQVTEALRGDPDFLALSTVSAPTTLIIEEARRQGYEGGFITTIGTTPDDVAVLDGDVSSGYIGESTVWEVRTPEVTDLRDRYAEEYDDDIPPNLVFAAGWDAMHLIASAYGIAGVTDDPQAIRDAMSEAIESTETVLGISSLDESGDVELNVIPTVVSDGEAFGLDEDTVDGFLADHPDWADFGK